jgi:hypothetical protein
MLRLADGHLHRDAAGLELATARQPPGSLPAVAPSGISRCQIPDSPTPAQGRSVACKLGSAMRYRYVVRIGPEDIGRRVVVRWHRPAASGSGEDEVADVVGPLEACDDNGFAVRNQRGELVLIPRERAMAAKVIPERA